MASDQPVALSYYFDGPPAESRYLPPDRQLAAVGIADGERSYTVTSDFATVLAAYAHRRRLYLDATVARQVERRLGLPEPQVFDDLRTRAFLESGGGQWDPITAALDCKVADPAKEAWAIYDLLSGPWHRECSDPQLSFLYRNIELPVIEPTVAMMLQGLRVDQELIEFLGRQAGQKIEALLGELAQITPGLLAYSQSQEARKALSRQRAVKAHANGLLKHFDPSTRCIHTSLDSLGTDTGRFSCDSPAMHGLITELRSTILASPGCQLIEADWRQVEPRVLAELSQDAALLAILNEEDIYRQIAAMVLRQSITEITDRERQLGKMLTCAIIYGKSSHTLSKDLQISEFEAQELIGDFFRRFPNVFAWSNAVTAMAQANGYVVTYYGRKRVLSGARSDEPGARAKSLLQAVNTVVQGTAADLHKMALARVHRGLPKCCRLLMSIHDAILVESPVERAIECASALRRLLEAPFADFPRCLPVEIKVGDSWGTMAPI